MKNNPKNKRRKIRSNNSRPWLLTRRSAFFFAAAAGIWLPKSYTAVLVDLDASALPEGPLATWNNTGTVSGNFVAPTGAVPSVQTVQGIKGVTFNGTSHYYTGPAAPPEVTGGGLRTVEAWILNPTIDPEETVFSWGRRGGPDGSNASFNHGSNGTFGALGHWGAPDVGWNDQIASNRWTYVVYTYDGITARVYMDGVEANTEDVFLDTWAFDDTAAGNSLPFRVAVQNIANGNADVSADRMGGLTIAKLRVHDVAVDPATIQANFTAESIAFGLGDQDNDQLPTYYENLYSGFLNPTDSADAARDQDTDGLTNLREFELGTTPDVADSDGDGINDGAEVNRTAGGSPAATNPLSADSDGDGLRDNVETGTGTFVSATDTGSDPLAADSDADTFGDLQEVMTGSNPNNATSVPSADRPAIVDLDATELELGALNTWTNTGSINGVFTGSGAPQVRQVQGINAVSFNGTSQFYTGPAAPAFITGGASRTVEAWIMNPTAADEETIFSWGRRGGGDGSNTSFNHGVNATWGAVGHWGAPDIGWNGVENVKQGQWTYVVYSYDGPSQTTRVYSDGVEVNFEELGAPLNTHAVSTAGNPLPFRVASQNEANGNANGGLRGSMSIGELRVFDRVLDPSVITSNFEAGQDKYGLIDYDNDGLPTWWERQYAFDERAANATADPDSDGVDNSIEFASGTNPTDADSDDDTLNDGAELNRALGPTNPLLADTDQDGLSDSVENGGASDPLIIDTDADGFADGQEVFSGSNPNLASSVPTFDPNEPLIDLNVAALADGTLLSWTNSGTMGGNFTAAAETAGSVQTVSGTKAVTFSGTNYYTGPVAPVFITGNASRTVDAWVFNPEVNTEESVFAWGRRNGNPDGSNASYTYGTHPDWGAMGQWGPPDVGFGPTPPPGGVWTHVAYVYDGLTLTATVYINGVQSNTEVMGGELAIHATDTAGRPLPFKVGAQNNADGSPGGQFGTLSIGRVRAYDQALTSAQIAAKFEAEKGNYAGGGGGEVEISGVTFNEDTRAMSINWTPPAGATVSVEATTDFATWSSVATGLSTGQYTETIPATGNRFYRLVVD